MDPHTLYRTHEFLAPVTRLRAVPIPPHRVSVEDLEQEARCALWKAATRYDPAKGPFRAFAIGTIRWALREYLRTQDDLTRRHRAKLAEEGALPPEVVSLEDPTTEDLRRLDMLAAPGPDLAEEAATLLENRLWRNTLAWMLGPEAEVLKHLYLRGRTRAETARRMGRPRAWVDDAHRRGLEMLRRKAEPPRVTRTTLRVKRAAEALRVNIIERVPNAVAVEIGERCGLGVKAVKDHITVLRRVALSEVAPVPAPRRVRQPEVRGQIHAVIAEMDLPCFPSATRAERMEIARRAGVGYSTVNHELARLRREGDGGS